MQEPLGLLPSAGLPWKENSCSKMVGLKCHSEGRGASSLLQQPCPEPLSLTHLHTPGPYLPQPLPGSPHPPSLPRRPYHPGCLGVLPL